MADLRKGLDTGHRVCVREAPPIETPIAPAASPAYCIPTQCHLAVTRPTPIDRRM